MWLCSQMSLFLYTLGRWCSRKNLLLQTRATLPLKPHTSLVLAFLSKHKSKSTLTNCVRRNVINGMQPLGKFKFGASLSFALRDLSASWISLRIYFSLIKHNFYVFPDDTESVHGVLATRHRIQDFSSVMGHDGTTNRHAGAQKVRVWNISSQFSSSF